MRGVISSAGSRRGYHGQHHDQLARHPGARGCHAGRGHHRVGLVDRCRCRLALVRSVHANLILTLQTVGAEPAGYRLTLVVADHGERLGAVSEDAARSVGRQRKDHNCAGHRLVIFILHLDDGFAGSALADVVRRTLALEHYPVEHRGNLSSRGNPLCQQERKIAHATLRRHYATPRAVTHASEYCPLPSFLENEPPPRGKPLPKGPRKNNFTFGCLAPWRRHSCLPPSLHFRGPPATHSTPRRVYRGRVR